MTLPVFICIAIIMLLQQRPTGAVPPSSLNSHPIPTALPRPESLERRKKNRRSNNYAVYAGFTGYTMPSGYEIPTITFYSGAPTVAVGSYLGLVGLETPEFRRRCIQCCAGSKNNKSYMALTSCSRCELKNDLEPSGDCPYNAPLGYSRTPSQCFYDRCYKMLAATGSCLCISIFK